MTPKEKAFEYFNRNRELGALNVTEIFDHAYESGHKDGYHQAMLAHAATAEQVLIAEPGYENLVDVLRMAHDHAAKGKGLERHANDLPFEQQRMLSITRLLKSPRGLAYQVIKKITEGLDLPTHRQQIAELLGAINYTAGIVIYLNELEAAKSVPDEQATETAAPAPEPKEGTAAWAAKHKILVVDEVTDLFSGKCICGYCDDAESSKVLTDHEALSTHDIEQLDQRRLQFREKRKGQHIDEGWHTTSFMHWAIMRGSPYAEVRILSADQLREDDARPKHGDLSHLAQLIADELRISKARKPYGPTDR